MRIPDIQARLRDLAYMHSLPELDRLADELRRRAPGARAPVASATMTPELAKAIRAYARAHPGVSQATIAQFFRVNPGRVSEALRGKRT
jgi:hypothetical protein